MSVPDVEVAAGRAQPKMDGQKFSFGDIKKDKRKLVLFCKFLCFVCLAICMGCSYAGFFDSGEYLVYKYNPTVVTLVCEGESGSVFPPYFCPFTSLGIHLEATNLALISIALVLLALATFRKHSYKVHLLIICGGLVVVGAGLVLYSAISARANVNKNGDTGYVLSFMKNNVKICAGVMEFITSIVFIATAIVQSKEENKTTATQSADSGSFRKFLRAQFACFALLTVCMGCAYSGFLDSWERDAEMDYYFKDGSDAHFALYVAEGVNLALVPICILLLGYATFKGLNSEFEWCRRLMKLSAVVIVLGGAFVIASAANATAEWRKSYPSDPLQLVGIRNDVKIAAGVMEILTGIGLFYTCRFAVQESHRNMFVASN